MRHAGGRIARRGAGAVVALLGFAGVSLWAFAPPPAKTYGADIQQKTAVPVASLLGQPERYVGRTVRVDGVVSAVCQRMGCWLAIVDPAGERGVRFKFKDGVAVLPRDAVGRQASAEGLFEATRGSAAPSDPRAQEAVGLPTAAGPDATIYWVRARGVVLY